MRKCFQVHYFFSTEKTQTVQNNVELVRVFSSLINPLVADPLNSNLKLNYLTPHHNAFYFESFEQLIF